MESSHFALSTTAKDYGLIFVILLIIILYGIIPIPDHTNVPFAANIVKNIISGVPRTFFRGLKMAAIECDLSNSSESAGAANMPAAVSGLLDAYTREAFTGKIYA